MKIGVFAPSSRINKDDFDKSIKRLQALTPDIEFYIHPQCAKELHQSAGSASNKAQAFLDLQQDASIDLIWTAVGGNRCASIFDEIQDFTSFKKPIVGFSDVTYLINGVSALNASKHIHGPCLQSLANERIDDSDITQLFKMISDLAKGQYHSVTFDSFTILNDIQPYSFINGHIYGGNLSLFQALCGTRYMPKADDFILFLEDIGDQVSRYDRMFRHLRHTGLIEKCRAILLGDFGCAQDQSRTPFGFSLDEILNEHFKGLPCPVFKDLTFGHRGRFTPLPVGVKTSLSIKDKQLRLDFTF